MAGLEIKRYELGPVIGTGAFATVYRGRDPRLNATVAVKVLADNWSADPSVRFRFGQEAALLRRVKSERRDAPLVEVFDIDEGEDGRPYFVMTFADRGTLAERMTAGLAMPVSEVAPIVDALGAGMAALHGAGVIHRDLKPSNLLFVTAAGTPNEEQMLIGDLGLAKDQLSSGSALTVAGGSPGYMAPEQTMGLATITPLADVFSASVIVLELLTGSREPEGLDRLPTGVATVVSRGMSMLPAERQARAEDWNRELSEALTIAASVDRAAQASSVPSITAAGTVATSGVEPADSVAVPERSRSWLRWLLATIGLAFAALLLVGAMLLPDRGEDDPLKIDVNGPETANIDQPIVLIADVPKNGSFAWIVDGQRLEEQDLRLTPRTAGKLEIRLEHRDEDGAVISVLHTIEVQP